MADHCTIELHADGAWRDVGVVHLAGPSTQGWRTPTHAGYDTAWAVEHIDARDAHAFCSRLPVGVVDFRSPHWPVFLIDMLPQGFGREELLRQLGLPETAADAADWRLLLAGAGNPIGNLRVKEAAQWLARRQDAPRGFEDDEVAAREEDFGEYQIFRHESVCMDLARRLGLRDVHTHLRHGIEDQARRLEAVR